MKQWERRTLLELIAFKRRIWEVKKDGWPEQAKGAFEVLDEMEKEIMRSVYTKE